MRRCFHRIGILVPGLIFGLLISWPVFSQQGGEVNDVAGSVKEIDSAGSGNTVNDVNGSGNAVSFAVDGGRMSLESLLRVLEETVPFRFYYKEEWFAGDSVEMAFSDMPGEEQVEKSVEAHADMVGESVRELLDRVLTGKPYTYKIISGDQVIILPARAVADVAGQTADMGYRALSPDSYLIIGDLVELGKYRTVDLTGTIIDGATEEPIIGAYVQVEDQLQGTVSNLEGAYSLSLNPGLYSLVFSSLGYEPLVRQVRIVSHGGLDVELFERSIEIEDVIVYGERLDRNVTSHRMSMVELDTRLIKQLPVVAGERDVIKGLTAMPGIQSVGEFSSGINVRGGGEDQNLYLFNDAPLFSTSHVFGLLSVVNPDMVDQLTLYKGHIPAGYGERISSVIDIRTRETVPEKKRIQGGIGLFDSKLMAELPLIKDKVLLHLGGRSVYSNWLLKRIDEADLRNSNAFFYDLNAVLHVRTNKSRIMVSAYNSFDDITFNDEVRYAYGSTAGSLNWNYIAGPRLATSLSLSYSNYDVDKDDIHDAYAQTRTTSGIRYTGLRYSLKYSGIEKHLAEAGLNLFSYTVRSGRLDPLNEQSLAVASAIEPERGLEGAFYLNDEYTLSRNLTFNAGIRVSGYAYLGPGTISAYLPDMPRDSTTVTGQTTYGRNDIIQSWFAAEPRLSAKVQLGQKSSIKVSYNRNVQYMALISNSSVSQPSDVWKLADPFIEPLVANQFALGYYRNFMNNTVESSVEVYYKSLANVIEYKKGAELEMAENLERQLIPASGRNYGIELFVKKNSGIIDGWLSYTFSRSIRKTTSDLREETLNNGKYFPSSFDQPHRLTLVANYNMNKRFVFSANFTWSSGRPITLPEYRYYQSSAYLVYFSEKNKYRMPDYHRLDFSMRVNESLRLRKKWKGSWTFSLLNVYARKNAYTIFYKKEVPNLDNDFNAYSLYKLYLIGKPILTVGYNFVF